MDTGLSAEQGDVVVIREALEYQERESLIGPLYPEALVALDQLAAALQDKDAALEIQRRAWGRNIREREVAEAALERAERMFTEAQDVNRDYAGRLEDALHRVEKAERALAEAYQRVEDALADLERAGSDPAPLRVVRFALRPSEASE